MRDSNQTALELDNYLLLAIKYIKNEWFNPEVGFVSCAIVDRQNVIFSTNTIKPDGKILHAENVALHKYKKLYRRLSNNSIAVVTLSPCIEFSKNRIGTACAILLLKNKIKRIHFGHLHDKQGTIETYKKLGFIPTLTKSAVLNSISKNLLQFYLDNKGNLMENSDTWVKAKRTIGYSLFEGI